MWSPFFTFLNTFETPSPDDSVYTSSREDTGMRRFICIHHLHNPLTLDKNIGIEMSDYGWVDSTISDLNGQNPIPVHFIANPQTKKLEQIQIDVQVNSIDNGLAKSWDLVNSILSTWTKKTAVPSAISQITITDEKHGAVWILKETLPTARYEFDVDYLDSFPHIKEMRSLYREGRNSNSIYYRFLCFFKIIETAQTGLGLAKEIKATSGVAFPDMDSFQIDEDTINRADIAQCGLRDTFLGMNREEFLQSTRYIRVRIAHSLITKKVEKLPDGVEPMLDFDAFKEYSLVASIVNLADILAYKLLERETEFLRAYENKINSDNFKS